MSILLTGRSLVEKTDRAMDEDSEPASLAWVCHLGGRGRTGATYDVGWT